MKNTKLKTALASVTLAAAALTVSLPAHANQFDRNCSDTTNSVAGGLIGGSVGAVAGREIAGRGDRSEGAILGAIIGGIAGAAIGDGASDCEKDARFNNRRVVTTQNFPRQANVVQTVGFNGRNNRSFSNNRGFSNNRSFGNNFGASTVSFGFNDRRRQLNLIDYKIDALRRERVFLRKKQKKTRSRRLNRVVENQLYEIDYKLDQLRRERRRFR